MRVLIYCDFIILAIAELGLGAWGGPRDHVYSIAVYWYQVACRGSHMTTLVACELVRPMLFM